MCLFKNVQDLKTGQSGCAHVPAEASPKFVLVCLHNDVRVSHDSFVGQSLPSASV